MTFELSEAQRETLECVRERPDAPQSDIAAELDVTRATVSRRLSAIPGFEWENRKEFLAAHFDENVLDVDATESGDDSGPDDAAGSGGDSSPDDAIESDDAAGSGGDSSPDDAIESDDAAGDTRADGTDASLDVDGVEPDRIAELERRVERLETTSDESDDGSATPETHLPRDLAHRTLHAAMESDRISEDEELELMAHLLDE